MADSKRKRDYETGAAAISDFTRSLDADARAMGGAAGRGGGGIQGLSGPAPPTFAATSGDNGGAAGGSKQQPTYLPCKTFQGARGGYYFRLGTQGPGYYLDRVGRHKAAAAAAVAGFGAGGSMMPPANRAKPASQKNAAELLADAEEEAGGERALDGTILDVKALRKLVPHPGPGP